MLDICPHLVPPLDYDAIAGSIAWIPEYEPPGGRKSVPHIDPIALPPTYGAVTGDEDLSEEEEPAEEEEELAEEEEEEGQGM